MRSVWYEFLRVYVFVALIFYFSRITITHKAALPSNHSILFLPNHQNAFLDALLVVTSTRLPIHFLARADVFRNRLFRSLLDSINLIPVYRVRDGWNSLDKNAETFERCFEILNKGESLLMFPEGNHSFGRRLRPLSRGFTKIVQGVMSRKLADNLVIVPVGINYESHSRYFSRVSVTFGNPIDVAGFEHSPKGANILRDVVEQEMRKLVVHIGDEQQERALINELKRKGYDVCDAQVVNSLLQTTARNEASWPKQRTHLWWVLGLPVLLLGKLLNAVPLIVWTRIRRQIKDPVLMPSIRFAFAVGVFPVYYVALTVLLWVFFGYRTGVLSFFILVFSMPALALVRRLQPE